MIERLHRQFLGLVKLELDSLRIHDVNNVQAMLLFNMGEQEISVGELISRGYYLGSNVSYNVKKLAESGYLTYERSMHDRRSIRVRLTRQGSILRDRLSGMLNRQIETLGQTQITDTDLESAVTTLARLVRMFRVDKTGAKFFWAGQLTRLKKCHQVVKFLQRILDRRGRQQ